MNIIITSLAHRRRCNLSPPCLCALMTKTGGIGSFDQGTSTVVFLFWKYFQILRKVVSRRVLSNLEVSGISDLLWVHGRGNFLNLGLVRSAGSFRDLIFAFRGGEGDGSKRMV